MKTMHLYLEYLSGNINFVSTKLPNTSRVEGKLSQRNLSHTLLLGVKIDIEKSAKGLAPEMTSMILTILTDSALTEPPVIS